MSSYLRQFSDISLSNIIGNTANEYSFSLIKFDPPDINLMNIPSTSGSFNAILQCLPKISIFARGQYQVINCIINDDGEITEDSYKWIIPGNNLYNPTLVIFNINDNTASDYYYTLEDTYTPVKNFPNDSVDPTSNYLVIYPTALQSIRFFTLLEKNVSNYLSAVFFITINKQNGNDDNVCVLTTHYVTGTEVTSEISLLQLQSLDPSSLTKKQQNIIFYLLYIQNFALSMYEDTDITNGLPVNIPPNGILAQTTISNTSLNVGLFPTDNITIKPCININKKTVVSLILVLENTNALSVNIIN